MQIAHTHFEPIEPRKLQIMPHQTKTHRHRHSSAAVEEMKALYHSRRLTANQCGSLAVRTIPAPLSLVWSVVRRFDKPQAYKRFVKRCALISGDGAAGSVRDVTAVSGIPYRKSYERLDRLDDDLHLTVYSIIGGDHRLSNYQSTLTLHQEDGGRTTVVMESYVVDIPADSCAEDTSVFVNTIIGFNLESLAKVTEDMAFDFGNKV